MLYSSFSWKWRPPSYRGDRKFCLVSTILYWILSYLFIVLYVDIFLFILCFAAVKVIFFSMLCLMHSSAFSPIFLLPDSPLAKPKPALGVPVNHSLNMSKQCNAAFKRGNENLCYINKTIGSSLSEVAVPIILWLVRLYFKYSIQFWTLNLKMTQRCSSRFKGFLLR